MMNRMPDQFAVSPFNAGRDNVPWMPADISWLWEAAEQCGLPKRQEGLR
jgi:hypothetical protein